MHGVNSRTDFRPKKKPVSEKEKTTVGCAHQRCAKLVLVGVRFSMPMPSLTNQALEGARDAVQRRRAQKVELCGLCQCFSRRSRCEM